VAPSELFKSKGRVLALCSAGMGLTGVAVGTAVSRNALATAYIANSLSVFLLLPFQAQLARFMFLIAFVGEGSLALWFLTRGVVLERI
jgi:hypothetical protein